MASEAQKSGFEVLVVLRDVGYVMLSHFPLVHRVEIGASIVILTGGLEGLSERTFETAVTGRSEGRRAFVFYHHHLVVFPRSDPLAL